MTTPIVELQALRKSYGNHAVLDGITMCVHEGSIAALLGPNGAGKTTLVRILGTLITPDSGRATISGHDVVTCPELVRSITALTGQYASVDELLTGEENLRLAAWLWRLNRQERQARVNDLLERFDLTAAARRPVRTYSGGMRRKLDIAMSLIGRPRILILDEPTTGLDPRSRNALWDTVRDLARDGVTVFLTTQYLEEADRLADSITLIDQGKVIAEGTPESLKAKIGVHVLELSFPDRSSRIRAQTLLRHSYPRQLHDDTSLRIPTTGAPVEVWHVLDVIHRADIPVDRMAMHSPTLDDVFLTLTGTRTTSQETSE